MQNDLTGKYSINDKMTLNLTARYYGLILIIKHSSLYKMMVLYLKTAPK
jgi:outer membrane scaffolding protein for murein synthesis (MipA/OmpV family)